jgi:methyltransferase
MPPAVSIALLTAVAVLLIMAGEAALSAHNESVLRARGAVEPTDDVYSVMRWAYPVCFAAMAIEGALSGPAGNNVLSSGLAVFGMAKALKMSVISALGVRWTFRLLILPGAPLIRTGPYRFVRHPNYIAVLGELAGFALIVWAPISGFVSFVGFGELIRRRIRVEERALGRGW